MREYLLQDAIGEIRDEYIADAHIGPEVKKNRRRWPVAAAACFTVLVSAIVVCLLLTRTPDDGHRLPADSKAPVVNDGGAGGSINMIAESVLTGTDSPLGDEEGRSLLEVRMVSIKNDLSASGVPANALRISSKGYSHMRTDESGNEMAVNVRDYLLYNNGDLVSIATVIKHDDFISYNLMFGGEWFESYDAILREYEGKELVYLYVGDTEAIVTPDNKVLSTQGIDLSDEIDAENADKYYSFFKREENTYVPEHNDDFRNEET